ncbi:MAG: transcription antitermination factor NusB [Candidatus Omnitrophica bacterium]|nr:transcription antitermination factor NusB [Candidatus Omnitrophota bacterium]
MRKRTRAREFALKALYQIEMTKDNCPDSLATFWSDHKAEEDVKEFAAGLVSGTIENLKKIDEVIARHTDNWEISRMAKVDRNIMRMAAYELLFRDDIPPRVSINEAVDIAKKYGDMESGKFVNGVLDSIKGEIDKK